MLKQITRFGKWKGNTSVCCTNGLIYLIVDDSPFKGAVIFINDNATYDEASATWFEVSTREEYKEQQRKLLVSA